MNFKKQLRHYTKYKPDVFARLEQKCQKETKFGKVANLCLLVLFHLIRFLKAARKQWQILTQPLKSALRQYIFKSKEIIHPVMSWDLPLPLEFAVSPHRSVLIIAELSIPQCTRYRVEQKIAAFRSLGFEVHVASFTDQQACARHISFASLVIFYRTPYWESVVRMIKECERLRIPTFYDIDDLVFEVEEYRRHPVLKRLQPAEAKNLLEGAQSYQDCLAACQYGIASTPVLAEFFKRYQKNQIFVVENALDELSLKAFDYSQKMQRSSDSSVVIGYGSGTKSHDDDFDLAKDGLIRVLREFNQVSLAIHGYLQLSPDFDEFKSRIFRVPFLQADQYLHAVSRFTINLAPLTAGAFNDAKSNIKFLEASACGVPTVASPCAAFSQVIEHNKNALLASNSEEWYQALKSLVTDPDLRHRLADSAQKLAFELYHPSKMTASLAKILTVLPAQIPPKAPKIMQVNCLYAPFSFGGATIVVERVVKELEKDASIVVVTANTMGDLPAFACRRYAQGQSHVYSIRSPEEMMETRQYENAGFSEAFGRILDRERPDLVHFHSIQMMGAGMLMEAKKRRIGVVVTAHDAWWHCERQFMLNQAEKYCGQLGQIDLKICAQCTGHADFTYRRMQSLDAMLSLSNLILAPSSFHADLVRANVSIPERVLVNKNGTVQPIQAIGSRHLREDGVLRFAYLGGGKSIHKGYFFIKEIFESLDFKDYELIITDIHQLIGHNGVVPQDWKITGRLKIVEPFTHQNIDNFFEGVDVLLFPSQWHESFGMTVREAILRNTYVISTRSGGATEVILDGYNGDLVDIGDQANFKAKIVDKLEHPQKLQGYVAPGKSTIISYADQAQELTQLYGGILEEARE